MKIKGILLAAGASKRFGRQKLLEILPSGVPILIASWRSLYEANADSVVVTREDDIPVQALLQSESIPFIKCSDSGTGMSKTLLHGVKYSRDYDGWIISLGDMPFIKSATTNKIMHAMRTKGDKKMIFRPRFKQRFGNPEGLSAKLLPKLLDLKGDEGARSILSEYQTETFVLDVLDEGILKDIDRPSDLTKFTKQQ